MLLIKARSSLHSGSQWSCKASQDRWTSALIRQGEHMQSRTTARDLHTQLKHDEQSAVPRFVARRQRQQHRAASGAPRHPTSASKRHRALRCRLNHKDTILLAILAFFVFGLASAAVRAETEVPLMQFVQGQTTLESAGVRSRLEVSVHGPLARVTVDQWFANPGSSVMDAQYTFPLSDQAVISELVLMTAHQAVEAQIREREEARAEFVQAGERGLTASLVEATGRSGLITTRIRNIPPGDLVQTHLSYVQPIQYSDGEFVLRIPMTYRPRYALPVGVRTEGRTGTDFEPAVLELEDLAPRWPGETAAVGSHRVGTGNPVQLDLRLDPGIPIDALQSRYHDIRIESTDQAHHIRFEDSEVQADRDFELRWRPAQSDRPLVSLFQEQGVDHSYLMMTLLPPSFGDQPRQPRSLIFVIDTSGSMAGQSMLQARESLLMALGSLEEMDRFNVLAFASEVTPLFSEPMPVNHQTLGDAIAFVDTLEADGGTRLDQALLAALSQPVSIDHVNQVIFVTDGSIDQEQTLFHIIRTQLGERRLHTVGIGSAPNQYFMRKAARMGRGTSVLISDLGEVTARMDQLLRRIEQPVVRDLKLDWPAEIELAGAALSDIHDGEALTILARVDSSDHLGYINGHHGDADWQQSLSGHGAVRIEGIATLWAQARIGELLDDLALGGDRPSIREAVTTLALEHRLLSPWTSLLAVDVSRQQAVKQAGHSRWFAAAMPANDPIEPQQAEQLLSVYTGEGIGLPQTATAALMNALLGGCLLLVGWALIRRMKDPS